MMPTPKMKIAFEIYFSDIGWKLGVLLITLILVAHPRFNQALQL
jgi:hypothetical protein